MTSSKALRASSCVGDPGELMGETVVDLEYNGGYIVLARISGLLRFRLIVPVDVSRFSEIFGSPSSPTDSSIAAGNRPFMADVGLGDSSVGMETGSGLMSGNVWLLGLLEFPSVGETRD